MNFRVSSLKSEKTFVKDFIKITVNINLEKSADFTNFFYISFSYFFLLQQSFI